MPWNFLALSQNSNISFEIIKKYPELPWSWYFISQNRNITWEIIINNPEQPWKWCGISQNPNITLQIIEANPDKPWDWFYVSMNPNIFKYTPNDKIPELIKKWHAANVIKRRWFKCITDPVYAICRKRLMFEFSYM
jgi:hypothetical protein